MTISPTELSAFSRLIDDLSGIVIDDSKSYLVEHRLNTVLREHNLPSYAELYHRVRYDNDTTLTHAVIDAITTNETLFFRDTTPYDALRNKVLPHLFDRFEGTPRLRIWSAACSTGQEPYSIAMTLRNLVPDIDEWDVSILGTDISDAAIGQASRGVYSEFEMQRG
ncbi:MAG: CheR family methyltransferase, partial [Planctomycetota bacterium]